MAKFAWNQLIFLWLLEQEFFEFQWDDGNKTKSQEKHRISCEEAESVFKNKTEIRILGVQVNPSVDESRYGAFG